MGEAGKVISGFVTEAGKGNSQKGVESQVLVVSETKSKAAVTGNSQKGVESTNLPANSISSFLSMKLPKGSRKIKFSSSNTCCSSA